MKVLLITPPYYVPKDRCAISIGHPLGIAYIGGHLREAGHEVTLIDGLIEGRDRSMTPEDLDGDETDRIRVSRGVFQRHIAGEGFPEGSTIIGLSFSEIEQRIRDLQPDVVGISCIFTSIFRPGAEIARIAKRVNPEIITVMGGTHVTVSPDNVLKEEEIDYILTGEGEKSMLELLEALETGSEPADVPGVGYMTADGQKRHKANELNWELDALALPALDLLSMEDYLETMAEGRAGKMYSTRGCPFNCSFCSVPLTSERRFRAHSIERIVEEARIWKDTYAVDVIIFEDDNINTNTKRFRQMLQAFLDHDIDVRIDGRNLRCDLLDSETLALMKQTGFQHVFITPESGSQRVMDEIITKKMSVDDTRAAVGRILDAGMTVGCAFVIGFPGETRDEIQMTIDYAYELKSLGVTSFWFSIATPIEGTALYNTAMEQGLIKEIDLDNFAFNAATFDTEEFTAQELRDWHDHLMADLNEWDSAKGYKPTVMGKPSEMDIRAMPPRLAAANQELEASNDTDIPEGTSSGAHTA